MTSNDPLVLDGTLTIRPLAEVTHSDGHVTISKTPKVTGKGQTYFVERFLTGAFSLDSEVAA